MLEAYRNVLGIVLRVENIGQKAGIVVPRALLAVDKAIAERFDIAVFFTESFGKAHDDARLPRAFSGRRNH